MNTLFPFSKGQPQWVIKLLLEKYTISEVAKIIQFNNTLDAFRAEEEEEKKDIGNNKLLDKPYAKKVSFLDI